jgi:hypothetical protein
MEYVLTSEKYWFRLPQKGHVLETRDRCFLGEEAMSTTKAATQERTASLADHLTSALTNSFTLGTDCTGSTHHYYRPADTIIVFDGRELDHYQLLNGRPLKEWRTFVAHERGWVSFGPLAQLGLQMDAKRKETGQ